MKASNDAFSRGPDGEQRLKFYAVKVFPTQLQEEDQMLLKRLRAYQNKDNVDTHMEWKYNEESKWMTLLYVFRFYLNVNYSVNLPFFELGPY